MVRSREELSCLLGSAGKGWRLSCLGYPIELGCPARSSAVAAAVSKAPVLQLCLQNSGDCPSRQKSVTRGVAWPISGARGRPPCKAWARMLMPARGGEPARGGCGRLVRERARRQVQLGLTDLAHLHFTREFAASPLFPSSYRLLPWLSLAAALRPDALNTRWDRKQVNNESSSPLYSGEGGSIC